MRRVRACAAVAAWISMMFAVSGCSLFEFMAPPGLLESAPPLPPPPVPSAPQSLAPPSPGEAYAEIVRWFSSAGYKDFQVQALVEHARTESGFRPCAVGPGGYRYLYQWSSTRLEHLHEFARTSGCPQLHTQLAYTDKELRKDPKFSCFWSATTERAAYAALRQGFGRGSC
jgi:hypothetical protein